MRVGVGGSLGPRGDKDDNWVMGVGILAGLAAAFVVWPWFLVYHVVHADEGVRLALSWLAEAIWVLLWAGVVVGTIVEGRHRRRAAHQRRRRTMSGV